MLAQETNIREVNKALLQNVWEAFNAGDIEKACAYTHPECTLDGQPFGREGDLVRSQMFLAAFPDMKWQIDGLLAEGEWVDARYTFTGTFTGSLRGYPPNGKEIVFTGISAYRIQADQIIEIWEYYDKLGLYQQLGIIASG